MLVKPPAAQAAMARPDPAIRLYVLAGPDEAGSRALIASFARAMGPDAERVDFKADGAHLVDEAAAISLFGARIWIEVRVASGSGDELVEPCRALLDAGVAGNPVVLIGPSLTAKSKLTRLAETHPLAVGCVSYLPNVADAVTFTNSFAQDEGLALSRDTARAIVEATGADRGLMAREVEKLALYLDAEAGGQTPAGINDWLAIGADTPGEDIGAAVNMVLDGKVAALPRLFAELDALGTSEIRVVRAIATRALLLARLRSEVDAGRPLRQVMESSATARGIFFKEKPSVTAQLQRWDAVRLTRLIARMHALERAMKAPDNAGALLLRNGLLAVAVQAASMR